MNALYLFKSHSFKSKTARDDHDARGEVARKDRPSDMTKHLAYPTLPSGGNASESDEIGLSLSQLARQVGKGTRT